MFATARNRRGIISAVEAFDGAGGRLHLVHLEYKDDQLPTEEELLLRRRIQRVLILTPASLRLQWRDEMWDKFALPFDLVDRAVTERLERLRRRRNRKALAERLLKIGDQCSRLPVLDSRAPDAMLYDERGLPQ